MVPPTAASSAIADATHALRHRRLSGCTDHVCSGHVCSVQSCLGTDALAPNVLDQLQRIVRLCAPLTQAGHCVITLFRGAWRDRPARIATDLTRLPCDLDVATLALDSADGLVVHDVNTDPRMQGLGLRVGDDLVRFYAGVAIRDGHGDAIGVLAALDTAPRILTEAQRCGLGDLADMASAALNMASPALETEAGRHLPSLPAAASMPPLDAEPCQQKRYLEMAERVAGLGHWMMDLRAGTLQWSKEVYRIHGVTSEEYHPALDTALAFYHPDDRDFVTARIDDAVQAQRPFSFQMRIVRADGEVRHVSSRGECRVSAEGETLSVFGVFLDHTEHVRTQNALRQSEERFSLATTGASVGIWDWVDVEADTAWWSPHFYRLLGYAPDEIPARHSCFMDMVHPEDIKTTREHVRGHFERRVPFRVEYRLRNKCGAYRWYLGSGQAIWDAEGHPRRMIGSIMDIHEQKTTEEVLSRHTLRLERANRDLDHFAYIASHDLRAPLRGMDNLAQWIAEDLGDDGDAQLHDKLDLLRGRVKRMDQLLQDILAYSRAGKHLSAPAPTDCQAILDSVLDGLAIPDGFVIDVPIPLPTLTVITSVFEQVLINLLSNAIKHHDRESGRICVGYAKTPQGHVFTIEDDGPGIAQKYRTRIFEMFQTLKRRDAVEGSGVGLAIVKKIVDAVGGKVEISSPSADRGSVFCVTLPRARNRG